VFNKALLNEQITLTSPKFKCYPKVVEGNGYMLNIYGLCFKILTTNEYYCDLDYRFVEYITGLESIGYNWKEAAAWVKVMCPKSEEVYV